MDNDTEDKFANEPEEIAFHLSNVILRRQNCERKLSTGMPPPKQRLKDAEALLREEGEEMRLKRRLDDILNPVISVESR